MIEERKFHSLKDERNVKKDKKIRPIPSDNQFKYREKIS